MSTIVQKRWAKLFLAVAILMLTQVVWWLDVFSRHVNTIAELRKENSVLQGTIRDPGVIEAIETFTARKKMMFYSETFVFGVLTALGLYLLFRALKNQEKARDLQKQFIETVSHESKTPLTALKLRLESILEKSESDAQLSKELNQSLEEVRRLVSVFDKTLSLNRMESLSFRFEEVSFSELTQQVMRRMDPLFKQKNVKLSSSISNDVWVRGDLFALQNLVQSLLENAVIYNDKETREVAVELREVAGAVKLKITDNGPGISQEERNKIFEKFFRGKSSRRIPGTGLGLYLVKHTVEMHSGKIELSSSSSNGAQFEVTFPRKGDKSDS
ncbi:MAG: sensor histidine kinase [Proteobacteria bacterium]|nr:sensor histidine kinase [Pseudomonadota bacterium]